MSSYYYAWQAAQIIQEAGLIKIVLGALSLGAAWIAVVSLPQKYQQIARRLLGYVILLLLVGMVTLLKVMEGQ
jgi:hypothetical protein